MDMARSGYYNQNTRYTPYYYNDNYSQQPRPAGSPSSIHLCLFLATVFLLGATSLYSRYESALESLLDQLRLVFVLSPLLLLLGMQYWAATTGGVERRRGLAFLVPRLVGDGQQGDSSYHGDGAASSPWGVALVLVLVLLLISYQSCFQDWWFPLLGR